MARTINGKEIDELLIRASASASELAEHLGVSVSSVNHWRKGAKRLQEDNALKLVEFFTERLESLPRDQIVDKLFSKSIAVSAEPTASTTPRSDSSSLNRDSFDSQSFAISPRAEGDNAEVNVGASAGTLNIEGYPPTVETRQVVIKAKSAEMLRAFEEAEKAVVDFVIHARGINDPEIEKAIGEDLETIVAHLEGCRVMLNTSQLNRHLAEDTTGLITRLMRDPAAATFVATLSLLKELFVFILGG